MFAPCEICRPPIHPYNIPVMVLYNSCKDQLIVGTGGVVSLNDLAVTNAMREYFSVKKKYRLELSEKVRFLSSKIFKHQSKE